MTVLLQRVARSAVGRLGLTLLTLVVFSVPYALLNDHLVPRVDLMTPLDRVIPFLPATLVVYWSWLPLLVVLVVTLPPTEFLRTLAALVLAACVCFVGFVLVPAHYPRRPLEEIAPAWRGAYEWLYLTDKPGNNFPSLHVTLTTLAALSTRRRRAPWMAAAALVSALTLTTRQHFVVYVAGGVALAAGLRALLFRRAP